MGDENALGGSAFDVRSHRVAISASQIEAVFAQELDDAGGVFNATAAEQLRHWTVGDFECAETIEVVFIDRTAGREDENGFNHGLERVFMVEPVTVAAGWRRENEAKLMPSRLALYVTEQ
jgi:hypothetical protein